MSSFTAGHEHFKADQAKQGTSGELKRAGVVSAVLLGATGACSQ